MTDNISRLLLYPFENDLLQSNQEDRCLIINDSKTVFNGLFLSIDQLTFDRSVTSENYQSVQAIPEIEEYNYIFYVLPKNKRESVYYLSVATKHLKKDGYIVAVAANEAGGKTLSKVMNQVGFEGESYSKNKCRIFVGQAGNFNDEFINDNLKIGVPHLVSINREEFYTQVGIYGWDKIDLGSKILIQTLPENLSGVGADFGCGYGYIAKKICEKNNKLSKFICIDIDWRSIECAKLNLKPYDEKVDLDYLWADLTQKPEGLTPLDFIVMNPPFHKGKETKIDLGRQMIKTAHSRLKNGGKLYIVANRQLPYEAILNDLFRKVEKVTEEQGFKVFHVQK